MDDVAMLYFMNTADSQDWQMMGYGYLIVIFIVGIFTLANGVMFFYEAYKKHKKHKKHKKKRDRTETTTVYVPSRTVTYTRDSIWGTNDGRNIKIRDLNDYHVANIIDFLKRTRPHQTSLIAIMKKELEIRGISNKFAERSQIPYKNLKGKWEIWDFENNKPVELEK